MIKNFLNRIQSRKFIVLVIAVGCFFLHPEHFGGDHLLWVFAIYTGGNILEHTTEAFKSIKNNKDQQS